MTMSVDRRKNAASGDTTRPRTHINALVNLVYASDVAPSLFPGRRHLR